MTRRFDWSHERFIEEVNPEWGNSPKSKILVVTRDKGTDDKLIEKCQADQDKTNHMGVKVTKWVDFPKLKGEIDRGASPEARQEVPAADAADSPYREEEPTCAPEAQPEEAEPTLPERPTEGGGEGAPRGSEPP